MCQTAWGKIIRTNGKENQRRRGKTLLSERIEDYGPNEEKIPDQTKRKLWTKDKKVTNKGKENEYG